MSEDLVNGLFVKLQEAIDKEEFENVLSISEQRMKHLPFLTILTAVGVVLQKLPMDGDLVGCKVSALLELRDYGQLSKYLFSKPVLLEQYGFEYAHALFRLGRPADARAFIEEKRKSLTEVNPVGTVHLEAQLNFSLGEYAQGVAKYSHLIEEEGETDLETYANYSACLVLAGQSERCANVVVGRMQAEPAEGEDEDEELFELHYNLACAHVDMHALENAQKSLKKAEEVCRSSLEEDGDDEDSIMDQLTPMKVLGAYVSQLRGEIDSAEAAYLDVIKRKPKGHSVPLAVAGNNVVSLHARRRGTASVFEAERKFKFAENKSVQSKLTKWQQRAVHLNRILLLLQMKSFDEATKMFVELQKNYPDTDIPTLIRASLAYRKKQYEEAASILKGESGEEEEGEAESRSPPLATSATTEMSLAQLYINRGDVMQAIAVLRASRVRHQPSVVGCLVGLYKKLEMIDKCLEIFTESVEYWKKKHVAILAEFEKDETLRHKKEECERILVTLLRELADFKFFLLRHDEAIATYEEMLKIDPENKKYTAGLVIALAGHDVHQASKHVGSLPPIELGSWAKKLAFLEKLNVNMMPSKKKATADVELEDDGHNLLVKKKKTRKKKRKNPTPKNLDPKKKPNPERWLPKWQRKAAQAKKARGKQKRWQGASVDESLDHRRKSKKKDVASKIRRAQKQRRGGKKKKKGRRK